MSILRKKAKTNPKIFALLLSEFALEYQAKNVRIFEVEGSCDYADYFVVMTGKSTKHCQALAEHLMDYSENCNQVEGKEQGNWILLDVGDVIIHIFTPEAREHFNFDKLWGHVPNIEIKDESPKSAILAQQSQ